MMHTFEDQIQVLDQSYNIASLDKLQEAYPLIDVKRLPVTLRILLENVARHMASAHVKNADVGAFSEWLAQGGQSEQEIAYHPAKTDRHIARL